MQYWLMEDSGIRLLREYIGSVVTEIMSGILYENSAVTFSGEKVQPRLGVCHTFWWHWLWKGVCP